MEKNQETELKITDMTSEGRGVGRCDGVVVFVPSAAVGDTVRVKILKVKKTCAFAKITEVIEKSADRIENTCPSFGRCGGCVYRHISYSSECRIKEKQVYDAVKRIGGIDMPPQPLIPSVSPDKYRNKAQYPVSQESGIGFYAFRSHRIVSCDDCVLQPEIFGKITETVSRWISENNISAYDESTGKGLLRHIYLRHAAKTDEIMVCLVINGSEIPFAEKLTESLTALLGDRLKSVQLNINREDTNVILGERCRVIYGDAYITDILCGVKIRLSPMSFYQVNRDTAERLYEKAAFYAEPQGKNILDLYCGAGTIGLSMSKRAKSVTGVEIIPEAVKDAQYNAELNGMKNTRFICADAAAAAKQLKNEGYIPDTVLVDPPRKGCTPELIEIIAKSFKPERVVYVSCDPATLARDIKLFGENGYSLTEYTPVDMFPRTAHTETVAFLIREHNL